jgi:hypothetical protein
MTVSREFPEQHAIAEFIAKHGVVRCPPAHAAPSQHSESKSESHLPLMRWDWATGRWRREQA